MSSPYRIVGLNAELTFIVSVTGFVLEISVPA